jgi:hypothetical protein
LVEDEEEEYLTNDDEEGGVGVFLVYKGTEGHDEGTKECA